MALLQGNLEDIAIERLKAFEPAEGYWVAYSGGKDSDVILDLVRKSGVKYTAHHSLTTADPPEVVRHVKTQPDVEIHRPKETMWELVGRWCRPPMRQSRYCCRTQKEPGGSGFTVITGIRWAESGPRSTRTMVEACYRDTSKRYLNLIIDWRDEEVWEHIRANTIRYCSLYDEGFKRLGCVLCPMTRDVELHMQRWPKLCRAWERAVKKSFILGKSPGQTPEEYWQWWLNRDAQKPLSRDETLWR